jgi:hypothetical protein
MLMKAVFTVPLTGSPAVTVLEQFIANLIALTNRCHPWLA